MSLVITLRQGWVLTLRDLKHWQREPWTPIFGAYFGTLSPLSRHAATLSRRNASSYSGTYLRGGGAASFLVSGLFMDLFFLRRPSSLSTFSG